MTDRDPIDEDLEALLRLDGPGPARRLAPSASAALIGGALDAWETPPIAAPSPPAAAAAPWAKIALVAAGVGGLVGAAVTALVLSLGDAPSAAPPPPPADVAAAAVEELPTASDDGDDDASDDTANDDDASDDTASDDGDGASDDTASHDTASHDTANSDGASDDTASDDGTAPRLDDARPAARARRGPPARPEDLLALGNRLRAERRWREAGDAYAAAARAQPGSATAHVADVAAAAIRLEHRR
ncbi:MAG: hypothetical protein KF729_33135, partial [Sandaracinaceae bacterium]|nr:hypothetical protein [Sandaracinaceae bacterium]